MFSKYFWNEKANIFEMLKVSAIKQNASPAQFFVDKSLLVEPKILLFNLYNTPVYLRRIWKTLWFQMHTYWVWYKKFVKRRITYWTFRIAKFIYCILIFWTKLYQMFKMLAVQIFVHIAIFSLSRVVMSIGFLLCR